MQEFIRERQAAQKTIVIDAVNICQQCEGGGWIQVHSERPPAFDICPMCHNPEGNEMP